MAIKSEAIPVKIAPMTKYGPMIVLCHMGWIVIEKMNATTVWTETATGIMTIAMNPMPRSRACFCFSVPLQPRARLL